MRQALTIAVVASPAHRHRRRGRCRWGQDNRG